VFTSNPNPNPTLKEKTYSNVFQSIPIMARPSQASASSNPTRGRTRQAAKEIEVVAVEAADAPTQRVYLRRPNTKTSPQTPKTPSGTAKKRSSRSAPQEQPEEEVEAEDEHT
jgi:hypothetical protein